MRSGAKVPFDRHAERRYPLYVGPSVSRTSRVALMLGALADRLGPAEDRRSACRSRAPFPNSSIPRDDRGQALVEFSLVLLFVIIPITIGIADGSILFFKYVGLASTAREGARAGVIYQSTSAIPAGETSCTFVSTVDAAREDFIRNHLGRVMVPLIPYDPITNNGVTTVSVGYDHDRDGIFDEVPDDTVPEIVSGICDPYRDGDAVRVLITHAHSPILGLVINLVANIDLSADAVMIVEPGGAFPGA